MVAAVPYQPEDGGWGAFTTTANTALVKGEFVVWATDGVDSAADSCTTGIVGIVMEAAADNAQVTIATKGIWIVDCATGFNPDAGDACYCATNLTVDAGTAGDACIGHTVENATASGGTVRMKLEPRTILLHA